MLKYVIVVVCTYNTPELNTTLRSIRASYDGEVIVAEDGDSTDLRCKDIANHYSCNYKKFDTWCVGGTILRWIANNIDSDIIIYSHSDIMFPPNWFEYISNAWGSLYDDAVGIINTQYYKYAGDCVGNYIAGKFNEGDYNEIIRHKDSGIMSDIRNADQNRQFGIGVDEHNGYPQGEYRMANIMSCVFSIRNSLVRSIPIEHHKLSAEGHLLLVLHLINNHMWHITATTPRFIHNAGVDVRHVIAANGEFRDKDHNIFNSIHGFNNSHMLWLTHGGIYMDNESIIVDHANAHTLKELDYLFNIMTDRIMNLECNDCSSAWCNNKDISKPCDRLM
jgi:hypothetical protein